MEEASFKIIETELKLMREGKVGDMTNLKKSNNNILTKIISL